MLPEILIQMYVLFNLPQALDSEAAVCSEQCLETREREEENEERKRTKDIQVRAYTLKPPYVTIL